MNAPVLLYVHTAMRAAALQREHNPEIVRVLPIYNTSAHRGSAVIVELGAVRHRQMSAHEVAQLDEWLAWVPTRLIPDPEGRRRVTIL